MDLITEKGLKAMNFQDSSISLLEVISRLVQLLFTVNFESFLGCLQNYEQSELEKARNLLTFLKEEKADIKGVLDENIHNSTQYLLDVAQDLVRIKTSFYLTLISIIISQFLVIFPFKDSISESIPLEAPLIANFIYLLINHFFLVSIILLILIYVYLFFASPSSIYILIFYQKFNSVFILTQIFYDEYLNRLKAEIGEVNN